MLFADVLDTKVINAERESDRASFVCPKIRCECNFFVALLVESFFKQLLGYLLGRRVGDRTLGVEMTLLRSSLMVRRSTVGVLQSPR